MAHTPASPHTCQPIHLLAQPTNTPASGCARLRDRRRVGTAAASPVPRSPGTAALRACRKSACAACRTHLHVTRQARVLAPRGWRAVHRTSARLLHVACPAGMGVRRCGTRVGQLPALGSLARLAHCRQLKPPLAEAYRHTAQVLPTATGPLVLPTRACYPTRRLATVSPRFAYLLCVLGTHQQHIRHRNAHPTSHTACTHPNAPVRLDQSLLRQRRTVPHSAHPTVRTKPPPRSCLQPSTNIYNTVGRRTRRTSSPLRTVTLSDTPVTQATDNYSTPQRMAP